ncbi:MAG: carotenoid oxygenase family protein [Sporichthyaceae bacterium]
MSNKFLGGGFAPIHREYTETDLPTTGAIPDWLDGRYVRNGPNPIEEIDPATHHWFLGDGMVHGVRLRDGRAEWYRNRWVGKPKGRSGYPLTDLGANTNVIGHAGRTVAIVESAVACMELNEELDTVGCFDFDGTLPGGYTAHPKRCPETGELHAVSYFFGWGKSIRYSVIDAKGRALRCIDIPVTGSPMMHDMSLTERHVVFYDLPVTFQPRAAAAVTMPRLLQAPARLALSAVIGRVRVPNPIAARLSSSVGSGNDYPYRWDPDYPARVGVLRRGGSAEEVRWFEVNPCYVFHPVNAYDDGDTIVLEVVRYEKLFADVRHGDFETDPVRYRWTVDLAADKVVEEQLDDVPQEFPRVDERLVGRKHRYAYAAGLADGAETSDVVLKHDLENGTTARRGFGAGKLVAEFVFEPSSPDAAEDDGVLIGYVTDLPADRTDLVLLDAQSLDTVATVALPTRVPAGFHGNWIPSAIDA